MGNKIAFITLPLPSGENQRGPQITEIAESYGVFPPLGLLRLVSVALKEGYEVAFLDSLAEGLTPEEIVSRLREVQPDLLCLTLQTQIFPHTLSLLRTIKDNLDCKVLGGGPHVGLYPRETMKAPEIDFALYGPAEAEFPSFMMAFNGRIPFEDVPGLIYRKEGAIVSNPPLASGVKQGGAPWPARFLLHYPLYHTLISQHQPYTTVMSSFGCPQKCIFCEQAKTDPAALPLKQAVAEIVSLVRRDRVKEVEFFDPVFTLRRERAMEFCHALLKSGAEVKWSARTRIDLVDEELLALMAAAGCIRLYVGIESASDMTLAFYRKEYSVVQAIQAVRMIRGAGITVFGFFIFGAPDETEEGIRQTIQLAKDLDLDYAQFNKLVAAPNTQLYQEFFGSAADYWGLLRPPSGVLPLVSKRFNEKDLDNWLRKANIAFYFRPTYIWKALRRTRSAVEIRRAAGVAIMLVWGFLSSNFRRKG